MTFHPDNPEEVICQCNRRISSLEKDNERLLEQYGDGVRPSWVSGDIGYNLALIHSCKNLITQAEAILAKRKGKLQ